MNKTSTIELAVSLNENNVPETIHWSATDSGHHDASTKAFFLSIWDARENNALRIDLWTEDMTVDEMKQFFHQSLLTMADSFEKATGETNICEDLRDYCYHFADKMNILPRE
ncbi:MAG: gliding motility protein GldC [Bacteroidetes bacterium]|nr:gliding motility protein GldC [Bacteroidota bacterium]MBM3425060.1 gliding motility protein GldC [Bacteroidota bacterium]